MKEKVEISKDTYLSLLQTLEKAIYIIHRCESREDLDNYAYSLAICCAKYDLQKEFLEARSSLYNVISEAQFNELEGSGFFEMHELENYKIPYDDTLEELREKLRPYLLEWQKISEHFKED